MANPELSKESQLVAFFVNACSEPVGRLRLMKLLYLADYESRRYLGKPITEIPYRWHDYGPFDEELYTSLNDLIERGFIRDEQVNVGSKSVHAYSPTEVPVPNSLTPDEVELLSFVCREYSTVELSKLLDDIVYQTEPMLDAKQRNAKGELLRMDMLNGVKSSHFTIPYSELLARSRQVRSGRGVPHSDAMKRVSAALHAAA